MNHNDHIIILPDNEQCSMLAAAYVPMQKYENIYPMEQGFYKGTIFMDLDKPFLGDMEVADNG